MKSFFLKYWPVLILSLILGLVILTNLSPKTFLMGWDNLLPELNFGLNLKRTLFAVWGEFQGLGTITGNANAADLIRQLLLFPFSLILPINLIRQFYVFSMLAIGSFGTYFLLEKIVFVKGHHKVFSLLGALFYLLNLSTLQTFYAPLETFITHFAFLPWGLLIAVLVLRYPTKQNYFWFIAINVLAIAQSQVPTVFMVYLFSLFIILMGINLQLRRKILLLKTLKLFLIIIILNSFWLLPFIYFFLTNSSVAFLAKINQMATETVFLQNKAVGSVFDIALLKGFWFNNVNLDLNGNYNFMLSAWRFHLANPLIASIGYLFFGIILAGIVSSLRTKRVIWWAFAILFFIAFTLLTTATPPFSWINNILRKFTLFNEVFRFPFTKFSILASLSFSIFFALGIKLITDFIAKYSKTLNKVLVAILFFAILLFSLPTFQGKLFYANEKIKLPSEYLKIFAFFQKQNPEGKIANFPQYTYWGWNYYSWGNGGSGFLWYGIEQQIIDRGFDVWSKNNENYYWELSQAITSQNLQQFANVLKKYQITWLLFDHSVINPSSPESLLVNQTEKLISELPQIKKANTFSKIDIYKVNFNLDSYILSSNSLPKINQYNWNNNDQAFNDSGNYISDNNADINYPFRSLFSNKNQSDQEFKLKQTADSLILTKQLTAESTPLVLNIPSFLNQENIIPVTFIENENSDDTITISAKVKAPEVSIDKNDATVFDSAPVLVIPVFNLPKSINLDALSMNVNGYEIELSKVLNSSNTNFFSLRTDNNLILNNKDQALGSITITANDLNNNLFNGNNISLSKVQSGSYLTIKIPKINSSVFETETYLDQLKQGVINCDNFNHGTFESNLNNSSLKLSATNSNACTSAYLGDLLHNEAYAIFINSTNFMGRPLKFWVSNETEKSSPLETYLPGGNKNTESTLILPPQDEFGRSYSLHFENDSIGNDTVTNSLGKTNIYPLPYSYLTAFKLTKSDFQPQKNDLTPVKNYHPNESLYLIRAKDLSGSMLILSQSFDNGWHAFAVDKLNFLNTSLPFLFGKELKNHKLINNWENGWEIDSSGIKNQQFSIIIVYLPQYLEYVGLVVIIITLLIILKSAIKTRNDSKKQTVNEHKSAL